MRNALMPLPLVTLLCSGPVLAEAIVVDMHASATLILLPDDRGGFKTPAVEVSGHTNLPRGTYLNVTVLSLTDKTQDKQSAKVTKGGVFDTIIPGDFDTGTYTVSVRIDEAQTDSVKHFLGRGNAEISGALVYSGEVFKNINYTFTLALTKPEGWSCNS